MKQEVILNAKVYSKRLCETFIFTGSQPLRSRIDVPALFPVDVVYTCLIRLTFRAHEPLGFGNVRNLLKPDDKVACDLHHVNNITDGH